MAASASIERNVELGFAEECSAWKLRSKYFPSKIGGKPAWLDLKNLPSINELSCAKCRNPCAFLMQIYAPVEDQDSCYHRSILLFICKSPGCSQKNVNANVLAFRCQLSRENDSYDFEPYEEDVNNSKPSAENFRTLCYVCGCLGPLHCSRCNFKNYCSIAHQKIDWKAGHNKECKIIVKQDAAEIEKFSNYDISKEFLLPEYEIVMEEEPKPDDKPKKSEDEALKEYKSFLRSDKASSMLPENHDSQGLLEELANKEDKTFQKFLQRVQLEPEQVLRYEKNGQPLWISLEHIPKDEDIPKCECGARRIFEFQVMPQLLNHLKLDDLDHSIDWGVLAIYTCSVNCDKGSVYHPEFVWKQDV